MKILPRFLSQFFSSSKKINFLSSLLFWSWNIIFGSFIYFGLVPMLGGDIFSSFQSGNVDFIIFFLVILITPFVSMLAGFTKFFNDSKKLLFLMYGVEVPILLLTLFRVFFLRELNPGTIHLLLTFLLASLFLILILVRKSKADSNPWFVLSGNSLILWSGLWVFSCLILIVPPAAWNSIWVVGDLMNELLSMDLTQIVKTVQNFFFLFLGFVFILFTATLFVFLPFVYIYISFRSCLDSLKEFSTEKKKLAYALVLTLLVFNTVLFVVSNRQDYKSTLDKLIEFDHLDSSKKWFLKNQESIKASLINIYLSPYKYLGEDSRSNFIKYLYVENFGLEASHLPEKLQRLFNYIAQPLIYKGSGNGMDHDQQLAKMFYSEFFDENIQEAERSKIKKALHATYSREQISAGLMNIGEESVLLEKQSLQLEDHGEWATLEIHETYRNTKQSQEEIYYSFLLPKDAVVTGLWLSDSSEEKKYSYKIASRGAAQKTYKQIQRSNQDPALIEQVGPQMYRLRVFPIPAYDPGLKVQNKTHMWLQVKMLKNNSQHWELPQLTERRNLFWDRSTHWKVQGKEISRANDQWLPSHIAFDKVSDPVYSSVTLGSSYLKLSPKKESSAKLTNKIVVVVDTSFSMQNLKRKSMDAIAEIGGIGETQLYSIDYQYQISPLSKEEPLNHTLFFGSIHSSQAVDKLQNYLSENNVVYDHLVFLTDKTSFFESVNTNKMLSLKKPTWFLMLNQKMPRAVEDHLLDQFYLTGGGLLNSPHELLKEIHNMDLQKENPRILAASDRYVWELTSKKTKEDSLSSYLNAFATQQLIYWKMKTRQNKNLKELNALNAMAKTASIVSPYSSMIVLINTDQEKILEEAEKQKDKFDREIEEGVESLTAPKSPFEVTAVPEPEEWALILIALCFLLNQFYRKKYVLKLK